MAYIETQPIDVKFSLKDENKGRNITISNGVGGINGNIILLKQDSDCVLVGLENIDWLIQVLRDIKALLLMDKEEEK